MITLPNGKICMNEQEAIQWLLDNYPIPFQCSADYAPNTEIGLGTIVNPTPSKVKVGSIIFFADSKVSTVIAVNETSFKCSEQYNDLVDDVVYVSNVQLNASGHLIVTLSNGTDIDAGLIKQVSGFSIDASQHLIASYNDGTTTDLGAIFTGNINIAGSLTADSIIENMTGYSFVKSWTGITWAYIGVVKNGNKLTFALAGKFNGTDSVSAYGTKILGQFYIPSAIGAKLFPIQEGGNLNYQIVNAFTTFYNNISFNVYVQKYSNSQLGINLASVNAIAADYEGEFRIEMTFLLSDNLAA